jgi:hypothetical protein
VHLIKHKTKTTSFRRCTIAEASVPRDFLLKTGLKSEFGSVESKVNRTGVMRYAAIPRNAQKLALDKKALKCMLTALGTTG